MSIVQSVRNGIPLLNGVYFPQGDRYIQYHLQISCGQRVLFQDTTRYGMPRSAQRYFYYYTDEIQLNAERVLRYGYLRHLQCGAAIMYHAESGAIIWIGTFSYAAAFEGCTVHKSENQTKILLKTADSELWQFLMPTPQYVKVSILPQPGRILRTK